MSEQMFDTSLGFSVTDDDAASPAFQVFKLAGVPGIIETTLSNAAPQGSRCLDTTTGRWHRKHTAGAGAANWELEVTQDDLAGAGTGSSWREPALVKEDINFASLAAAETSMNGGTVDGVTVANGDRILYTDIVGQNQNVFIVTGTPGAGATLVEDTNLATENDAIFIIDGTSAGQAYIFDGTNWYLFNQSNLDELGYIRTFIGKGAAGSETPSYSSQTQVTNGDSLEVAIGKLDAQVGTNETDIGTLTTSVGNIQTEVDNI